MFARDDGLRRLLLRIIPKVDAVPILRALAVADAVQRVAVLAQPIVIEVANPCDEGVEFLHDYGSFTLQQYGYRSCPVPLF